MKDVDDNLDDGQDNLDDDDDLNLLLTRTSRAVRGALPDQSRRGRRSGLRCGRLPPCCVFLDLYIYTTTNKYPNVKQLSLAID